MIRQALVAVAVVVSLNTPATAQTARELLDGGLTAYRALEMEAAARFFRRALESLDLSEAEVPSTLAYLGAAEHFRNRQNPSREAFQRLVYLDPRYRLDPLTFPPDVTRAFDAVRLATLAVAVEAPQRVSFEPGRGGLTARVYPSGPHVVRIRIEDSDGNVVRALHDDEVADSLAITWDGTGDDGATLESALYVMSFASTDRGGRIRRTLDVPVRLGRTTVDGQPLPPRPALLPETATAGPALVRLGLGLGAAALSWVVTPAFTDNDTPRVALTVGFSAAGIIGFIDKRPGKPLTDNIEANRATLAAWEAQVQRVNANNRGRRPGIRIVLETGRPSIRG